MAKKAHLHIGGDDASFEAQVAPSLALCSRVGNIYTGSLYLGLAGLLHAQELSRRRVGLFSYGSGCTSEFFSGTVVPRAAARIAAARIDDVLAARERITVDDYERIMAMTAPADERPPAGGFRFAGVDAHRRQYIS